MVLEEIDCFVCEAEVAFVADDDVIQQADIQEVTSFLEPFGEMDVLDAWIEIPKENDPGCLLRK